MLPRARAASASIPRDGLRTRVCQVRSAASEGLRQHQRHQGSIEHSWKVQDGVLIKTICYPLEARWTPSTSSNWPSSPVVGTFCHAKLQTCMKAFVFGIFRDPHPFMLGNERALYDVSIMVLCQSTTSICHFMWVHHGKASAWATPGTCDAHKSPSLYTTSRRQDVPRSGSC